MIKLTFLAILTCLIALSSQAQDSKDQAFLGLYTRPVDAALASHLKLKPDQGYVVYKVFPKSPASKAGIERFDILLKFNNHKVFSDISFNKNVQLFKPGEEIKVTVLREGKEITQNVTLGVKPKHLCGGKPCPEKPSMFDEHIKSQLFEMMRQGEGPEKIFSKLEEHMRKLQNETLQGQNSKYQHSTIKVTKKDKQHHITLKFDEKGRFVTVNDPKGKLIYSGRIDTDAEKKLLTEDILAKVEKLSAQTEKHLKANNIPYKK